MTRSTPSTTNRIGRVLLAVLLAAALAGAVASPAAAQSSDENDGWTEGMFSDATDFIGEAMSDLAGKFARGWEKRFGENPNRNATENVEEFATTFNDLASTSPTFGDYLEGRVKATDNRLTYEVTCSDRQGRTATRYVVADRNGDRFVNERVVTPSEFESMNRTVDYWIEADWYACENAPEELNKLYDNYVLDDEDIPASERARLAAQYKSGIETNLWDDVNTSS